MGEKKLLELAKPKLRCLSKYIEAYATLTLKFPTDTSWFKQPTFNSSNILTKINNRNRTGHTVNSLKQESFNLPTNFHCRLSELYTGGRFIQINALQELVRGRTGNEHTEVSENSHLLLQNSMRYVIGRQKS